MGYLYYEKLKKITISIMNLLFVVESRVNPPCLTPSRGSISQIFPDITGDFAFSHFRGQRYTNETFIIRLP